jgi:hypothetical protein
MKTWGSGGTASPLLTSRLDGGVWSASRPGEKNTGSIVYGPKNEDEVSWKLIMRHTKRDITFVFSFLILKFCAVLPKQAIL